MIEKLVQKLKTLSQVLDNFWQVEESHLKMMKNISRGNLISF